MKVCEVLPIELVTALRLIADEIEEEIVRPTSGKPNPPESVAGSAEPKVDF
jgi:hypothetical protein